MIECGFFNAVDNDRVYNAEDMSRPYHRLVSNGIFPKNTGEKSDDFQVVAHGTMTVNVNVGEGIFDGHWAKNTNEFEIIISMADVTLPRIDSIFMRVNYLSRTCELISVTGTPAEIPEIPKATRNNNYVDYRLANIKVNANSTSITQVDVEDTRAGDECGFITALIQQPDISVTYEQWQAQFDAWFLNLKQTLATATIISSFTSQFVTTEESTTEIPINVECYNSVLDILQVYKNGLLLVKDVDYTVSEFDKVILTTPVEAGTKISFIVYKSVDGSEAETVVREVEELFVRIRSAENRISALEGKTDEPLWSGATQFGADVTIQISKPLNQCKNGWLLVWSDYNVDTMAGGDYNFFTTVVSKNILKNVSSTDILSLIPASFNEDGSYTFGCKRALITKDTITGSAGNVANATVRNICLREVYEF